MPTAPRPPVHVLPIDDLRAHKESTTCWCVPWVYADATRDAALVIVHHSADGRELVEQHGLQ